MGNSLITICSRGQIKYRKSQLKQSAACTKQQLLKLAKSKDAIPLLANLKFEKVGFDPLNSSHPLNLIEQLNQTFTYLASLLATEYLLREHPLAKPFTLNLGTRQGTDIRSECGSIAAEVFSEVRLNNKKLRGDCKRLNRVKAEHKYVFFMCPKSKRKPGKQPNVRGFPRVTIVAVTCPQKW